VALEDGRVTWTARHGPVDELSPAALQADMDSPEQGLIRVEPVNLQSLAASLKG